MPLTRVRGGQGDAATVLPGCVGQRPHPDEPGPLQQHLPRRLVERAAVNEVPGGGVTPLDGSGGLGDHDERRSVTQHPPALRQQRQQRVEGDTVDHTAEHDAAGRAVRTRRHVLRRLGDGHRAALLEGTQRHRTPRLHTVSLRAARLQGARRRSPSPQSAWTIRPPGGARRHVRRHRPGPGARARPARARRHVHRPVLGVQPGLEGLDARRQEAERLDDVAHRLLEIRLVAVRRAPGAVPAGPQPVEGPGPPPFARLAASESESAEAPGWYGP